MSSIPENQSRRWPKLGDRLVHKFRGKPGEVVAEVVSVDQENGTVSVQIGGEAFASLWAAAKSVSGYETNGWQYWGLKPQVSRARKKTPIDEARPC